MNQSDTSRPTFLGTYFDRSLVLRVSRLSVILGWVILGMYLLEYGWSTWQSLSAALVNGFPVDFMFLVINLRAPFQGAMLLAILYAVSQALLILLDIEDNTRRAGAGGSRR